MLPRFIVAIIFILASTAPALFSQVSREPPYYSGRVTMEDGTPPKGRVVIESVCSGVVRQETTLDSKGGFGFKLGAGSGDVTLEAGNSRAGVSSNSRISTANLSTRASDCVLQAKLVGYTSTLVYLANIQDNHPDVGTLVLKKAADQAPPVPKDAQKAFDKGAAALKDKKVDEAIKNFEKAAQISPSYSEAWMELGQIHLERKQMPEARAAFEGAIKGNSKYVPAYLQLVNIEAQSQNWKGIIDLTEKAMQSAPNSPQLYLINGIAHLSLKEMDAAEKVTRDGLKLDTKQDVPKLRELMGELLARKGDYAAAVEQYEAYLLVSPFASDAATVRKTIADLQGRIANKK
jgi:Flp pilus assembly protein TadD